MTIITLFKVSTIIIAVFIQFINADIVGSDRELLIYNCGSLEFRCTNGECIPSEYLCDGRANCIDGSDESRAECTKPQILCPEFAFRCNYGACVDGDAICNGINDCVDNSDELLPKCRTLSSNNATCTVDEFRCTNGQCIHDTLTCDGAVDCPDGSDETSEICSTINCPQFTFRCAYGACIDVNLKCNGVRNCRDGSDEDPNLCRDIVTPISTTQKSTTDRSFRRNCPVPLQPPNGHWQLHKSLCPGDEHCTIRNSDDLQPGTFLVFSCDTGYRVKGSSDVFCGLEGKWSSKPICVEIRCKPLSSASTGAQCTYNNNWTPCEVPVLPNTTANVFCRNSYHTDTNVLSNQREIVRCNLQGQWEPEPIKCIAECGHIRPNGRPLIVNGTRAKLPDFPWHATLYIANNPQDENKIFICGASIIQTNLLITAAHCVYDETYGRIMDPKKLFVLTGNNFLDYNSKLNVFAKKANVKNIYVNCNYLGLEGRYAGDIAIIQIDRHFTFSTLLMPVCMDDTPTSDLTVLEVGQFGKIVGFGRTGPNSTQAFSQILQELTVPYVSHSECHAASVQSNSSKFITLDKFCAGYTNGSSACDGDSGGGLVFNAGGLYYLRGIVSIGIGLIRSGGTRICDSNSYTLYTRISSHIEWIQDVLLRVEFYNAYPTCSNRSSLRP